MASLSFDDLSVTYRGAAGGRGEVQAVRRVSLAVPERGALGVAGESGSGKSTLAMAALRLLPSSAKVTGSIRIGEQEVLGLGWGKLRTLRWGQASIVFQGAMHSLNPVRRVGWQIDEALRLHAVERYATARARSERVAGLLAQVDLDRAKAESFPHELSGGQRQRVMIAMALACDPELIIADEPTTALDVVVQAQILARFTRLVQERGISLLMISHDLSVLAGTCDRIAVMYRGEIVESGEAGSVIRHPRHPHTIALTTAFPVIGDPASRMRPGTTHADDVPDAAPPASQDPLLACRGLSVTFPSRRGTRTALNEVSLDCRPGEIIALVGQSGSGKTTLGRTLLGLQEPTSGTVLFDGRPLPTDSRGLKAYRRQVQLVLQDPSDALNPRQTVYESVAEGLRLHRVAGDERTLVARALTQAELTPAEQFFTALPGELSGGQRQRVVIAGALALNPRYLVADEPVASLDASARGEILALLLRLRRRLGLGALVITHDLGLAWNIADRVVVLFEGRIVESGIVEDVLLDPQHEYTKRLIAAVPTTSAQRA